MKQKEITDLTKEELLKENKIEQQTPCNSYWHLCGYCNI